MEYILQKQLKIKDVKSVWTDIQKTELPVDINFKDVEEFDGAGLQLIVNFLNLNDRTPEKYKISGLKKDMKETIESYGYSLKFKGDEK